MKKFFRLPVEKKGNYLLGIPRKGREKILKEINNKELLNILHHLDPDKATDLLQNLKSRRRKKIIDKLSGERKEKIEFLLKFDPRTAAGLMSLDYVEIDKKSTFEEVSKLIKKHEKRTGKFPTILVSDEGILKGELHGHILALHKGKEKIEKYVKTVPHIEYDKDEGDVISVFKKYPHNKIVVLDHDKSIIGVIYSDDILSILDKKIDRLYDFAGISQEEDVLDSAFTKVKYRYKWLILNLFTAFIAAYVVSLFQNTISAFVLLAAYMPIIAGMGGNAGTQALAVSVRGIALKEVELKTSRKVIFNETISGLMNGFIVGILVALVAVLLNQSYLLGLVALVSMIINLFVAGLFGSTIPLVLKRLGKDPASSASIFITTATDVLGFLVFLGLATLIL